MVGGAQSTKLGVWADAEGSVEPVTDGEVEAGEDLFAVQFVLIGQCRKLGRTRGD